MFDFQCIKGNDFVEDFIKVFSKLKLLRYIEYF